jgi:hypothetical protein
MPSLRHLTGAPQFVGKVTTAKSIIHTTRDPDTPRGPYRGLVWTSNPPTSSGSIQIRPQCDSQRKDGQGR